MIRTLSLRTQAAAVLAFMLVFALGAGMSTLLHVRTTAAYERGLRDDHSIQERLFRLERLNARMAERVAEEGRWLRAAALVLFAGLLISAGLAAMLSRLIIEPLQRLADYAAGWKPGDPWTFQPPGVGPEIGRVYSRMKDLIERLNGEYEKERDMNRLKSQLVAMVSHDLNNCLSVIHAAASSLEETDPAAEDPKREKTYRILKGQSLSLARTVSNLLNLGRMESGKLSLSRKKTDVAEIVRASVELMQVLLENKRLEAAVLAPQAGVQADADPEALSLVVTNLLSNAIKYTPEGGRIEVSCETDGAEVAIRVSDNGIGIAPEERETIFSGYYRTEAGRRAARGFGIGLALTKAIVEAHGGRLDVESEPGKGSTFTVRLSSWARRAAAPRAAEAFA